MGFERKLSDYLENQDKIAEKVLREEKKVRSDPKKSSIEPSFLESEPGYGRSNARTEPDSDMEDVDFEDISSDKEEDTTEGEITDTHTSD